MSWASERRFSYAVGTAAVLILIVGGIGFALYYKPSTCFDGRQNGKELGADCGGNCERLCEFEVSELRVLWSRAFEVTPGHYNVVAYVENPNRYAGIRNIRYRFRLVDAANATITEREGETFLEPNGNTPIFEADIATGDFRPARTFFEFIGEPVWYRGSSRGDALSIADKRLLDTTTRPRLDATLVNSSVEEFKDVEVVSVVFASDGNAVAASRTVVGLLKARESKPLAFTWPRPFERRLEQCAVPSDVAMLIDTSGSMNDQGGVSPQPISGAKAAAALFTNRLQANDRSAVVTFATTASVAQGLTPDAVLSRSVIENLFIKPEEERGATNIVAAIQEGSRVLLEGVRREQASSVMVLLTDGRANAPSAETAETEALVAAKTAKERGVTIYSIGLGGGVNRSFLEAVATSEAHYFYAATPADLGSIYEEISTSICERGPAVIEIVPRSLDGF